MLGDNVVNVDHKKEGWFISFKCTDKRIFKALDIAIAGIYKCQLAEDNANFEINEDKKKQLVCVVVYDGNRK